MHTGLARLGGDAVLARRAKGALFLCLFGGMWLAVWVHETFEPPGVAYAGLGIVTGAFLGAVARIYRRHAPALDAESGSRAARRQRRGFYLVNLGQWVLLLGVGNLLAHMGRAEWIVPAAIFIIGWHFVPLAKLFGYPPHYLTGAAMVLLAASYPALVLAGFGRAAESLGAGLILWCSAAWAVRRTRRRR